MGSRMGFSPGAKVVVEQLDDQNWKVREAFAYTGKSEETFDIRVGQGTDFASVPKLLVWFLPRYGRYTKAAILHDYLWRERAGKDIDYIDADGMFRRAMRELGVPFLRRWIMWAAVRWGAVKKKNGTKGWWREGWRVILFTLIALPIVAPPAVMVAIALALFFVLELIVWVPLRIAEAIQRARGVERVKPARLPKIEPKL